jgi:hypothetical protein
VFFPAVHRKNKKGTHLVGILVFTLVGALVGLEDGTPVGFLVGLVGPSVTTCWRVGVPEGETEGETEVGKFVGLIDSVGDLEDVGVGEGIYVTSSSQKPQLSLQ